MKRILFVDDEPRILDALRRSLTPHQADWDMSFAGDGNAALAALDESPFDVVVSDMQMPGMDGAELLAEVHRRSPETVRILLTAHAEKRQAARAVSCAHQFLSKPCSPERIRDVVIRAQRLHELLSNPRLRRAIGDVESLPAPPRTFAALTAALSDPEVGIRDVAEIVSGDPAISLKVLQMANSSFFGAAMQIADIEQAVMYLGTGTMRLLTLSVEAFRVPHGGKQPSEEFLVALQQHSLWSAGLAKAVCGGENADDAFMAGMLHDIGLLVMATMLPDELDIALESATREGRALHEVEFEQRGSTHAEIGAYLLGLWGLPYPVVEAVAHHHLPSRVQHDEFELLTAVHVATALTALRAPSGHTGGAPAQPLDGEYLTRMGVTDKIPEWEQWLSDQLGGDLGG